jgi:CheY-like chemotaxis protein
MPKMDGFQVVEKIRETEKADQTEKPTVIIGYSAILDKQKIQKALENGINDFIQKPVLQHILNGCLKKHGF